MEFTKNQIIQNDDGYIIFGQIQDKCTVIFSKFQIETIKLNLSNKQFDNEDFWTMKVNNKEINVICQKDHFKDNPKDKYITITETKEEYITKVLPYINNIFVLNTKWIFNILSKKEQLNTILIETPKLMVIKDTNWHNDLVQSFYILAIPHDKIKTLRDLRSKHVELLENMKKECIAVAKANYIDEEQLYFFFHYHPSFYQLHLHCCIINHPSLTSKYHRCNMLDNVIENIKRNSYYYKNATMKFEIPDRHVIVRLLSK